MQCVKTVSTLCTQVSIRHGWVVPLFLYRKSGIIVVYEMSTSYKEQYSRTLILKSVALAVALTLGPDASNEKCSSTKHVNVSLRKFVYICP